MDKFWELVSQSVIVQALVTLALVLTCCYLWIQGHPLPGELLGLTGSVLGFWFGTKTQILAQHQAQKTVKKS